MQHVTLPIGKRAAIHSVWVSDMVFCKKYEDKFRSEVLQSLADTELWYTGIFGNPHSQRGEGDTPEWAIKDAISRNKDMIRKLEQANSTLEHALTFQQSINPDRD